MYKAINDNQLVKCLRNKIIQNNIILSNKPNIFTHEDLSLGNLVLDNNFNIVGIIDWELSKFYPNIVEMFSLKHYFKEEYKDDNLWYHLENEIKNFLPYLIVTEDEDKIIDIIINIFLGDRKIAYNILKTYFKC